MNIFKSVKFWVGFFIVAVAVIATILGYVELPNEVEAVKSDIQKVDAKVDEKGNDISKLSNTVEKYIAVQAVQQENQEKRQELLEQIVLNMQK